MTKSKREKRAEAAARAKAQRAERLRKERQRRILTMGAAGLALVLVVAAAVWWQTSRSKLDETAAVPEGATSSFGLQLGESGAEHEVVIYEDFLCPACKGFKDAYDETLDAAVADGTATVEYRVLNFLQQYGDYSERSANAFAVVLDTSGPEVAKEFHDLLYAEQPSENGDLPDDAWLIEKAVEAGAEESEIAEGIEDLAFEGWVENGVKSASSAGVRGTPTVLVDGEAIEQTELPSSPPVSGLGEFVAGLPKAELHVHHVGSASPRIVSELAARHPGTVPSDLDDLRRFFEFRDFAHFIEIYLAVVDIIRTPEDVRMLTYEVAREMAQGQQLRYAELTCTPYTSVRPDRDDAGMPIEAYTEAIEDARVAAERDFGLVLRWIYDIPGEAGLPAAEATLSYALDHGPDALVGFGLGGPEVGVPRPQFQPFFDAARAVGLHSVPHAGETTGPETVWDAIRHLGAVRIGHGTSSATDPELLAHLAAEQITLEVCPSSNVATRAVAAMDEHPLAAFVEAGVPVTINSDDPPMFGTTLNDEYEIAADLLSLSSDGVADLSRAAVRASFAPDDVKARILGEIDDYVAG